MRVLSDAVWRPDHSWTLDPGDMLYVPPHCPHGGVQVGAGQTLSVGFLAPSYEELLSSFAADAIVRRKGRRHYERDLTHVRALLDTLCEPCACAPCRARFAVSLDVPPRRSRAACAQRDAKRCAG